jgi:hypothetical protein
MIKISIIKFGQITNQATFPSQEEAQAWLSKHEGMGTFGQKASSSEREVEVAPDVWETKIVKVEGYAVKIEDMTAEIVQGKINEEALKYLADTDWYCARLVDSATPIPEEIKLQRAVARASIKR